MENIQHHWALNCLKLNIFFSKLCLLGYQALHKLLSNKKSSALNVFNYLLCASCRIYDDRPSLCSQWNVIFLEIVQLHNIYNHLSSCWEIETVKIGNVCHLKLQRKKEHRSLTLIRCSGSGKPLLSNAEQKSNINSYSFHCALLFFEFTNRGCLLYPNTTLCVIRSNASCLSP